MCSVCCVVKLKSITPVCRSPESGKFVLVKSGILGIGFRNPAKGNQNHANDCNPEYKFHWQGIPNPEYSSMESGILSVKSRDQDCPGFPRTGRGITSKTGQRCSPSPGLVTMAIMTHFQSSYPGLECMGRGPPITLTGTFNLVSGNCLHAALRFNVFISVR